MKIALAVTLTFLLLGCSEEQHEETKEKLSQSVEKITIVVKEESEKIVDNVEEMVEETVENTQESIKKTAKEVNEKVTRKSAEIIKESSNSIDEVLNSKVDGSKVFVKCSSCHGQKAEKKALNKSLIIKGWSVSKIITAINGYKDGTYGSTMKGVMKPQVSKLSNVEIQAVAEYISHL